MMRVVLILTVLTLAGCGGEPLFRDNYLGLSWLEPERKAEPVRRDGNGDPILPPKRTE